ncbi:hypothetical protein HNO86_00275 [Pseudomonas sp. C1C7]|uniref:hypothetical protein n=1 Tax=Pseudomonas sp. C1C7 TaxID=2735272 RepID=UPI00158679CB|nr:hypothetical protein [Pseudomonas sp. C1C7]NUT73466.1 hypothetical protein [Pseudomonas sp. C1C7]
MAKKKTCPTPLCFSLTEEMLVTLKGAMKMEAEMKGLRGKVAAFKKDMEGNGLEPLDVSGFISGGGLLEPFQDGIKRAIEAQDELAKKSTTQQGLKLPKVVQGETSVNLEKFNKSLDDISLKVGEALLPAVNSIVTALTPVVTSIAQLIADAPFLAEGLAAAAVAFTVVTVGVLGLVGVLGVLTSPLGAIAAGIAAVVAIIVIGARLITNNWSSISGFFSGLWSSISGSFHSGVDTVKQGWDDLGASARQIWDSMAAGWNSAATRIRGFWNSTTQASSAGWAAIQATFDGLSLRQKAADAWQSIQGLFSEVLAGLTARVSIQWEQLKSIFSRSPSALVQSTWQPLGDVFAALWDVLRAGAQSLKVDFQSLFDGNPVEAAIAKWDELKGYFSDLWASLTTNAQSMKTSFGELFNQSPLESIKQVWEPILGWFGEFWSKLQSIVGQVKDLVGGSFSGFFATITGNGTVASPGTSGLSSPLPQTSSTLIQQSAANNRTQLEGGLTVRFENAPAGLRTDQPQTNQPGLALSSRIGYRSLSMGGSNGLA